MLHDSSWQFAAMFTSMRMLLIQDEFDPSGPVFQGAFLASLPATFTNPIQGAKRPTPTQSTCLYYCRDNEAVKCTLSGYSYGCSTRVCPEGLFRQPETFAKLCAWQADKGCHPYLHDLIIFLCSLPVTAGIQRKLTCCLKILKLLNASKNI
jgi:hypothetical protein